MRVVAQVEIRGTSKRELCRTHVSIERGYAADADGDQHEQTDDAQNDELLIKLEQIEQTPSREDGIPAELEEDLRAYGCKLIQQAGILLKQ